MTVTWRLLLLPFGLVAKVAGFSVLGAQGNVLSGGRLLGERYELLDLFAQGPNGTIHRGRHVRLQSDVVIKLFQRAVTSTQLQALSRDAAEAHQVARELAINVFDAGFDDRGQAYLVSEWLDGHELGVFNPVTGKAIELVDLCLVAVNLARGLDAVHARGVFHGHLKPSNLLMVSDEEGLSGRILDFGIRHIAIDERSARLRHSAQTRRYAAPEQALGAAPSAAADRYSFARCLLEVFSAHPELSEGRSRPRAVGAVTSPIDELAQQLLATDVHCRPKTASELVAALLEAYELQAPVGFHGGRSYLRAKTSDQTARSALPLQVATGMAALAAVPPAVATVAGFEVDEEPSSAGRFSYADWADDEDDTGVPTATQTLASPGSRTASRGTSPGYTPNAEQDSKAPSATALEPVAPELLRLLEVYVGPRARQLFRVELALRPVTSMSDLIDLAQRLERHVSAGPRRLAFKAALRPVLNRVCFD